MCARADRLLGRQPQGISKQQPARTSARLQAIQFRNKSTFTSNIIREIQILPSPLDLTEASQRPQILQTSKPHQKRKRVYETKNSSYQDRDWPLSKRPRTSSSTCTAEEKLYQEAAGDTCSSSTDPLQYWIWNGRWPKEYFEQDSQVREDFEKGKSPEQGKWSQEHCLKEPFGPMSEHLKHLLARNKRRKNSEYSLETPSDQLPREVKSAQYKTVEYEIGLEVKGSYMCRSNDGCKQEHLEKLLYSNQTVPQDSLFRDDLFDKTCENIRNRNEAMVIRDISSLIVPPAQTLATYGATHLNHLYECINEGWNSAIPFHGTRPQPDYSVGFGRSAFTKEQLKKLEPFVGEIGSKALTYFMATTRMYFPFLTCEVKCGAAALQIADRQNAHSMTIAVKGVVELYRAVKREKELHREILAFSISHDHRSVVIYGHYAIIEEEKTTFYRHPVHDFSFTALEGKDKWNAYKFTKNVYDIWMPIHYKRICSAIDELPSGIKFNLSQSSSQSSQLSNAELSMPKEANSQSSVASSQEVTPTTSFTQTTERPPKKPRNDSVARLGNFK